MKKIFSLFIALMAVFSLSAQNLENGFYLAGTMNGWGAAEGYHFVGNPDNPSEFMLETTLAENDEFKVINYLNGEITAWYPGEGGNYVVDAAHAGDVTIYFQSDYKADWAEFGGYFYVAVPEAVADEWAMITFAEAADADAIAEEASYTVPGTEFALTLHDSGNKMVIDGNDCRFGTAEGYTMYNFRIKSGGASSSTKNYFTLNIPEAGTLRIAPRTGSNSATDRALVIAQGETELYNAVVQESQAIEVQEGENTVKVYPYVDVTVAAGEVRVSYTAGMNFYAFAFKAAGGDEPQPQECDWDAIDFLGDGSTEQTHSNQFKVCKVGEQPNVVNIQTPGFAAETGIYVTFPSAVFGEISLAEGQYVIEGAGIVLYLSAFTQEYTEVTVNWDGNDIVFTVYNAAAAPQPVEHTYTVAGGSADLFGTTWDPANTANDMTKLEDGTYKWEKTEVTLPAGNVEFKVVEDHAWTVCYPAENYQLVIPEAGVYTITITYNPEGNVVAGDAVKTGDAVVDPVVSIAGSMNSWNASADVMVLAEDKATASLTLNLAAQTYEFKVVINGGDWRSNAQEFTRENATAAEMTGNLDNMHLVADVAGEYVFTWTFATNTLVITYPNAGPEPLTIPEDAPVPTVAEEDVMAIYCNHYATNNANFGISGWAGGYQTLDLNGINVGYWTNMTWECIIDPAHTDDAHDFSAYKNLHVDLWAPLPAKIKFTAEAVAGGNYKEGQVVEMQQGWNSMDFVVAEWPGNYDFANLKCFVFEQYQTLAGESFEGNPFAFANIYFYGKEEQGVENTAADAKVVKMIENGQLIIIKNGVRYNAQGAIVR